MNADLLGKLLGQGTYHYVYSLKNNSHQAVKIAKGQGHQLRKEAQILLALNSTNQFPKVSGMSNLKENVPDGVPQGQGLSCLVMDRLGMSLEELLKVRKGKLSLKMIKNISLQLLNKIVLLHSIGIIHNDIKPSNILFGVENNRRKIYLIDYGLASLTSKANYLPFHPQTATVFLGNLPFASLNKLAGRQPKQSDDIQSILYIVLWLLSEGKTSWVPNHSTSRDQSCQCQECNICLQSKMRRYFVSKLHFLNTQSGRLCKESRVQSMRASLFQFLLWLNQKQGQQSTYQVIVKRFESLILDICQ